MSKPQTYANHGRIDPLFHCVVVPILVANLVYRTILLVHHPNPDHAWTVILAFALLILAALTRSYALRVQDRVIRMEERIRIAAVASPQTLAHIDDLGLRQLVALRFAPYAELGPLADRALSEQLTPKQIKQAIVHWRPDTHRV